MAKILRVHKSSLTPFNIQCKHRIVVLYTFPVKCIDITINHSNTDIDSYKRHVLNDHQVPMRSQKLYSRDDHWTNERSS